MSYLVRVTECEHGQVEMHEFNTGYTPGVGQRVGACPGGSRERVTVDREKLETLLVTFGHEFADKGRTAAYSEWADRILAALGVDTE